MCLHKDSIILLNVFFNKHSLLTWAADIKLTQSAAGKEWRLKNLTGADFFCTDNSTVAVNGNNDVLVKGRQGGGKDSGNNSV